MRYLVAGLLAVGCAGWLRRPARGAERAGAAGAASADRPESGSATALLAGMRTERDEVVFTGLRVLRRYGAGRAAGPGGRAAETFYRLVHAGGGKWRSERLSAGPGSAPARVLIRRDGTSYVGRPGGRVWYRTALAPLRSELADLDLALANYRAVLDGSETVAGRRARRVRLSPRRGDRPSLVLLVDAERRFRLGVRRYDPEGRLVREMLYLSIRFGAGGREADFLPPGGARVVPVKRRSRALEGPSEVGRLVDFPLLEPTWVPAGFRRTALRAVAFRVAGPEGRMLERWQVQLGYGDGVATISLFESRSGRAPGRVPSEASEASEGGVAAVEVRRHGEVWVVGARRGAVRLTLVGDIGRNELVRMMRSVGERGLKERGGAADEDNTAPGRVPAGRAP